MKSFDFLSVGITFVTLVHGFSFTNCDNGEYKNYGDNSSGKCIDLEDRLKGERVAYDSNKGCTLNVYGAPGCGNPIFTTGNQDCNTVGFTAVSVKCE